MRHNGPTPGNLLLQKENPILKGVCIFTSEKHDMTREGVTEAIIG